MTAQVKDTILNEISESNIIDALDAGGLLWNAYPTGIMTDTLIEIPGKKALLRDDDNSVLGVVGDKYEMIQNADAFSMFEKAVSQYDGVYERAAAIDGGKQVVLQAKLNKSFSVDGDDRTDLYMTMVNSFDGSTAFRVMVTPVRLFCTNTLAMAQKKAVSFMSVRHTRYAQQGFDEAMKIFAKGVEQFWMMGEASQIMSHKMVNRHTLNAYLDRLFGDPEMKEEGRSRTICENKRNQVESLFEVGKGNSGKSMWHLYNGVTEYVDHYAGKDDDKRFKTSLLGGGWSLKQQAFNVAMEMSR